MLQFITSCSVHVGDERDYESGHERQMATCIRGSPTKKAKKGTASLARPTDGFLDFRLLGLVLGPLIQGNKWRS